MEYKFFSRNGQILPVRDAVISLKNIEYAYGFGVYETVKIRSGIIYFLSQHLERLFQSALIIGIDHQYSQKEITTYVTDLLEKEKIDSYNIKIIILGGKTKLDAQLFILPLAPLFPNRKFYTEGIKTKTFQYERLFPQAKSLNMLASFLAYKKAKMSNCYDALLTDHKKNIVEGTRTNFFAIKNMTIFTQSEDKILPGITRKTVLHVARKLGFDIQIKDIQLGHLAELDGAFLTSTSSKIVPIKQIDDIIYPKIPDTLKLLIKEYDNFLKISKGIFNPSK